MGKTHDEHSADRVPTRIKVRFAALIFDGEDGALIRRTNNQGTDHYSLPGGNVEPAEPLLDALRRELLEELGLQRLEQQPAFTRLLDAMVTRPGSTPPRKLHLAYRIHLAPGMRQDLRLHEDDDTLGKDLVVWLPYRDTRDLNIFSPVPIAGPDTPTHPVDAASAMLADLNDTNYQWI
ncbi:NUDIX hydrolase [Streptomyces sp. NPDC002889]|uniref:NUDIX hydrolase n=1 Tax=Streptomyces sp. NPDC002889 TaxID=3364669 RepID=UPI003689A503